MIRVRIPSSDTPSLYELELLKQELGLDTESFLDRYMELVVRDISFPCQPVFKYKNVSLEHGEIYADIDPETLPDYSEMKKSYKAINRVLLDLVSEYMAIASKDNLEYYHSSYDDEDNDDDSGPPIYDAVIIHQPKLDWSADVVSGYLSALIRMVRSKKRFIVSDHSVLSIYTKELLSNKDVRIGESITVTRDKSIELAEQYINAEGLGAIMRKYENEVESLVRKHGEFSNDACTPFEKKDLWFDLLKAREKATLEIHGIAGTGISKALQAVANESK